MCRFYDELGTLEDELEWVLGRRGPQTKDDGYTSIGASGESGSMCFSSSLAWRWLGQPISCRSSVELLRSLPPQPPLPSACPVDETSVACLLRSKEEHGERRPCPGLRRHDLASVQSNGQWRIATRPAGLSLTCVNKLDSRCPCPGNSAAGHAADGPKRFRCGSGDGFEARHPPTSGGVEKVKLLC